MQSLEGVWQQIVREFEAAQAQASESARARVTDELNQLARRLRQYNIESDWYDAVLDGASRFASEVALFTIQDESVLLKGARHLTLPPGLQLPFREVRAFQSTIESGEPATVLCTKAEVSDTIASAVPVNRAFLVPIANEFRKVALLFAVAAPEADTNALELIAQIASAVLKRPAQAASPVQIAPSLSQTPTALSAEPPGPPPDWSVLPGPEKLLHVRAQRLARARVAEMQLYRPEACRAGRVQADLYLFLKQEIDTARGVFRSQFMSTTSMVDYLHLELLRQLAENDESILGADYPGQMV